MTQLSLGPPALQDIGYDGIAPELGFDTNVINKYFDWYFPVAVRMGEWFDKHPGPEAHVYTAHGYIVSLYLSCPAGMGLHCPNAVDEAAFRTSVLRGHITWTALPWNGQIELMDSLMLESALRVTSETDADCGVQQKRVLSQVRGGAPPV
jgi:hypothetical protein